MRRLSHKRYWMLALLLFGLFSFRALSHPDTAYAFEKDEIAVGTSTNDYLDQTDIISGTVTDSKDTGIVLYYQIDSTADHEAYISSYRYAGPDDTTNLSTSQKIALSLPAYISHDGEAEPYKVVGINGGVFKNFQYLGSVVFPDTYRTIGAEAFMNCPLTGVTLNENLQSIRDRAFYGCSGLQSVLIPAGVNEIGTGVFANCANLQQISVDTGNRSYCAVDHVLYNYSKTILVQCPAALTVGNSTVSELYIGSADCPVRQIADSAFEGCTNLKSITGMYSTVTAIGEQAFYGCSSLTNVKIPTSVVSIGNQAFTGCNTGLTISCDSGSYAETYAKSYNISTSVTCTVNFYNEGTLVKSQEVLVGGDADAPALPEKTGYTLTWDKSYTNVQQSMNVYASWKQNFTVTFKDAYSGQMSEQLSYYGGAATPPTWTRQGYILAWDSTEYAYVTGNTTVNAVWLISLTDTTITEEKLQLGDTRTIGNITYQVTRTKATDPRVKVVNCTKQTLKTLTIPDKITFGGTTYKVTNIGADALRDMPNLKTLVLSSNLVKINKRAFYNCPNLKNITIRSKKLTGVGEKAFSKIYVKAKVNVPNAYIKKYRTYLRDAGLTTYATVY